MLHPNDTLKRLFVLQSLVFGATMLTLPSSIASIAAINHPQVSSVASVAMSMIPMLTLVLQRLLLGVDDGARNRGVTIAIVQYKQISAVGSRIFGTAKWSPNISPSLAARATSTAPISQREEPDWGGYTITMANSGDEEGPRTGTLENSDVEAVLSKIRSGAYTGCGEWMPSRSHIRRM